MTDNNIRTGEIWLDRTTRRPTLMVEAVDDDVILVYDPYEENHFGDPGRYREVPLQEFLASHDRARLVPFPIDPASICALSLAREIHTEARRTGMLVDITNALTRFFSHLTDRSGNLCLIAAYAAAYAVDYAPAAGEPGSRSRDKLIENILLRECARTFLADRLAGRPALSDEDGADMNDSARTTILITRLGNLYAAAAVASKNGHNQGIYDSLVELATDAMSWVAYNISDDFPAGEGIGDITSSI